MKTYKIRVVRQDGTLAIQRYVEAESLNAAKNKVRREIKIVGEEASPTYIRYRDMLREKQNRLEALAVERGARPPVLNGETK